MRINEVDTRSLEQKMKDLIRNPSTHPNIRATAEKKLADIQSRSKPDLHHQSSATARPRPAPSAHTRNQNFKANAAYTSTGFKPNSTFSKKA